jgi:hypothetical protein
VAEEFLKIKSVWGRSVGEGRERTGHGGVKRVEVHNIYTCEDSIMKLSKPCLEKGRRGRGERKYNGGGELVQGNCMHVWNYHNKIPS